MSRRSGAGPGVGAATTTPAAGSGRPRARCRRGGRRHWPGRSTADRPRGPGHSWSRPHRGDRGRSGRRLRRASGAVPNRAVGGRSGNGAAWRAGSTGRDPRSKPVPHLQYSFSLGLFRRTPRERRPGRISHPVLFEELEGDGAVPLLTAGGQELGRGVREQGHLVHVPGEQGLARPAERAPPQRAR